MLPPPAPARQGPPSYGLDFITIDHAGNRAATPEEMRGFDFYLPGAVSYDFRIMRTNLTNAQWLEFVHAYAPYYTPRPDYFNLTGRWIDRIELPGGGVDWVVAKGADRYALQINWEMAARYSNWLHNGKTGNREAFESGAYDTSTFFRDDQGVFHHQLLPSPGARFWLPTWDEYAKAVYWDPHRYGPGEQGYWLYPNRSDSPLRLDWPWNNGEAIGDLVFQMGRSFGEWDVMQYPDTHGYVGLLDVTGTAPSWMSATYLGDGRLKYGTYAGRPDGPALDRIDHAQEWSFLSVGPGVRVASIVPGPPAWIVGVLPFFLLCRRRSR